MENMAKSSEKVDLRLPKRSEALTPLSQGRAPFLRAIPEDKTFEAERFLVALDVAGLFLTLLLSWGLALLAQKASLNNLAQTPVFFSQSALFLPLLAANALAGVYAGFGLCSAQKLRIHAVLGGIIGTVALGLSFLFHLEPAVMGLSLFFYLAVAPLWRIMGRSYLYRQGRWGKPALVVGSGRSAEILYEALCQNWHLGLVPITQKEAELQPVQAAKIDSLVLAAGGVVSPSVGDGRSLYVMRDVGVLTRISPPLISVWDHFVHRDRFHNPCSLLWRAVKRSVDLMVGSAAFLIALPLIAIFAGLIYAIDPGPVFFGQERFGFNGKRIKVWKLRSMYQDSAARLQHLLETDEKAAAEWAARHKLSRDPRVLPKIGAFIRRYSIDELPQLWGVITGELSLVGPRVFVDYDLAIYSEDALKTRQSVVPGLTGFWQVSVRSDGSNDDKVRYDMAYVRHWSIWMDLDILYRTFGVVLTGRGAV